MQHFVRGRPGFHSCAFGSRQSRPNALIRTPGAANPKISPPRPVGDDAICPRVALDRRLYGSFLLRRMLLPRPRASICMTLLSPLGICMHVFLGPRDVTLNAGMRSGEYKAAVAESGIHCGDARWDLVRRAMTGEAAVDRLRSCAR